MSPFQGSKLYVDSLPRALPWAILFCPFRAIVRLRTISIARGRIVTKKELCDLGIFLDLGLEIR